MSFPLSSFGWASGQSAAAQSVAMQSALDCGEPIALPRGTVLVDRPLVLQHCPSLIGWGADSTNGAVATSQLRCGDPAVDILQVKRSHVHLAGFHVHRDAAAGSGRGIVVGEGAAYSLYGVVIERVSLNQFHRYGVHMVAATGWVLRDSWLHGSQAGVCVQNVLNADTGDAKIAQCDLMAGPDGAGLRWYSGGGLSVVGCKFLFGKNHINMDWNQGGSGNFALVGCSLENCDHISFDITGAYQFKRMQIVGNTWGVNLLCFAVRTSGPFAWLEDVTIIGNTFSSGTVNPVVDLGCVQRALVTGNVVNGNGVSTVGIYARAQCLNSKISNNLIYGCGVPAVAEHASTTWAP